MQPCGERRSVSAMFSALMAESCFKRRQDDLIAQPTKRLESRSVTTAIISLSTRRALERGEGGVLASRRGHCGTGSAPERALSPARLVNRIGDGQATIVALGGIWT